MPRRPRVAPGGYVYHVLNRTAGRFRMLRREKDFLAFEQLIAEAQQRHPTRILAWCVMGNHWHFIVWPRKEGELSAFFRWLAHTHAMRFRVAHRSVGYGHLYQGRFKNFPVQADAHLLSACRYVERNALSAGMVKRAQDWRWSSLWVRENGSDEQKRLLTDWPVDRPKDWLGYVNAPWSEKELERLRQSRDRGRPFGDDAWTQRVAKKLPLQHTLRREGRPPRKETSCVPVSGSQLVTLRCEMYRLCKVKRCDSHELIPISTDDGANDGQVLGGAMSNFCRVRTGTFGMQPEIEGAEHRAWVMFGEVASERVGPNPTSWLKQRIDVRLDRPGTTRPRRSIYASGTITVWGPATQELATTGYLGQSFRDYLLSQFMLKWRDEIEIQGLNLLPVLPNTRVWIGGQPSKQWSYTPKGKIIEIDNATLPEPEEHFINYFHLIPPPPPDPDEEAELDDLMSMPLKERVEHLSQIAQEAKRRKRAERGE